MKVSLETVYRKWKDYYQNCIHDKSVSIKSVIRVKGYYLEYNESTYVTIKSVSSAEAYPSKSIWEPKSYSQRYKDKMNPAIKDWKRQGSVTAKGFKGLRVTVTLFEIRDKRASSCWRNDAVCLVFSRLIPFRFCFTVSMLSVDKPEDLQ